MSYFHRIPGFISSTEQEKRRLKDDSKTSVCGSRNALSLVFFKRKVPLENGPFYQNDVFVYVKE